MYLIADQNLVAISSRSSAAKDLCLSGLILVFLGGSHLLVWLTLGGEWEGPISWRKPILFGLSTGLTLFSLGCFFDQLRPAKSDSWLMRVLSVALLLEVGLITIQQWRGQASHFNHDSLLNTTIEYAMTFLIVVATVLLIQLTLRSFSYLNTTTDYQIAVRAGMSFLIISCLIGFLILMHGHNQLQGGQDPSTFGKAGVTKFPHGIAIHSLQFFPVLCWLLAKLGLTMNERIRSMKCIITTMSGLLCFSAVQTLSGKDRFQLSLPSACLFAISVGFLIPVAWMVTRHFAANGLKIYYSLEKDKSPRTD